MWELRKVIATEQFADFIDALMDVRFGIMAMIKICTIISLGLVGNTFYPRKL